jgi:drug/metabolite transporter (DMT)-like permease
MNKPEAISQHMTPGTWGLLVLLSLLWGGAFFFGQVAVRELPPMTVALGRVSIAAAALVLFVYARGDRMPGVLNIWLMFAFMGLVNNVIPFSLILFGQTQITSGLASILNATTPIFTVVLAHFLTDDEKFSAPRVLGVGCGITGIAVMMGWDAMQGATDNLVGQVAVLGAALSYATAMIFGRRLRTFKPTIAASGQLVSSSILLLPVVLIVDQPWTLDMPGWQATGSIVAIALGSTSGAYIIYFRLLATAGSTNASLVTLLIPPSAILLGVVFLGEVLLPTQMMGMAIVGLGLLIIDGRLFRRPS